MTTKPYRNDLIRRAMAGCDPAMTSERLAELSGQSRSTISKILNGSPDIRLASLRAIVNVRELGLTMQDLFTSKPQVEEETREPALV